MPFIALPVTQVTQAPPLPLPAHLSQPRSSRSHHLQQSTLINLLELPSPLSTSARPDYTQLHLVPGLQETPTATIPSPHSLAAILSPSTPAESNSTAGASRASTPKRTATEAFSPPDQPYLHPNSPNQIRPGQASAPSPGAFGGSGGAADEGISGAIRGGQEEKKKMARSSIACARCRRSKVKCVNNGVDSTCKSCEVSGRECTYPPSGATTTPKRAEPTAGIKAEDGENRKRVRKTDEYARRSSQRVGEDALDSPILTEKTWKEVYKIFKLHFSTEMPFLHPNTFRHRIRQAAVPREASIPAATDPEGPKLLLLAVLTLTARFHPGLVLQYAPNDPMGASEYFASALITSSGLSGYNRVIASLDRIQALLMLSLYEWSQAKGARAWVHLGDAIRLAQLAGLPFEDDGEASTDTKGSAGPLVHDNPIEKEVRRRTMWSCFVMDRMLSAGRGRIRMIELENLKVQLPRFDDQFSFVRKGSPEFLGGITISTDDEVLGRYIRVVEIWGRVYKWSYAGGRRTETLPPWDDKSTFYQLRQQLHKFDGNLPSNLEFTQENLTAWCERHNATAYVIMHTLRLLCLVMLHREYVPFIPLRCQKPIGPLDEPTFPKEKYDIPEGFWEESAETLFKSGRDIVEIVKTCQDRDDDALPESTQIVFALYIAAFTGVYSNYFPYMDVRAYMRRPDQDMTAGGTGYAGLTIKILKEVGSRTQMANGYVRKLHEWHKYYQNMKRIFQQKHALPFVGGGLEEYKSMEKELKEFGSLDNSSGNFPSEEPIDRSRASTNEAGPSSTNGDTMQGIEGSSLPRLNGSGSTWAPINGPNQSIESDERSKSNAQSSSGFPYGYQTSPGSTPRLTTSSNGDSSSAGLPSPYGHARLPDVSSQGSNYGRVNQGQPIILPPISQHAQVPMAPPSMQQQQPIDQNVPNAEGDFNIWIGLQESNSWNNERFEDLPQAYPDYNLAMDHLGEHNRALAADWNSW